MAATIVLLVLVGIGLAGLTVLIVRKAWRQNNADLALRELRKIGELGEFTRRYPEVPYRLQVARLYHDEGQHQEELKEYLLVLQKEPDTAEHHYQAGRLFEARKNYEPTSISKTRIRP